MLSFYFQKLDFNANKNWANKTRDFFSEMCQNNPRIILKAIRNIFSIQNCEYFCNHFLANNSICLDFFLYFVKEIAKNCSKQPFYVNLISQFLSFQTTAGVELARLILLNFFEYFILKAESLGALKILVSVCCETTGKDGTEFRNLVEIKIKNLSEFDHRRLLMSRLLR